MERRSGTKEKEGKGERDEGWNEINVRRRNGELTEKEEERTT